MSVLTTIADTRSYPLVGFADIVFGDIVGAVAVDLLAVPVASIITQLSLNVTTSFAGGTTHDCDIGDATTADRYNTTIIELDGAAGLPANPVTGNAALFKTTSAEPTVQLLPTSTGGDPTSGAAYFFASYIVESKADENYES